MARLVPNSSGVDPAFERIYRRHAADVYRYALAVLRNQADAEDVTQTTFMNAYRALERGERPQTPHNWLIAIAHNVCRQRFRQASRRVREVNLDEDVADRFVQPEDDDAPTPEAIRRALGHLAFNQRAALVMRELEGRSYAEIADLLGLSVGAVETLIFRARRALREQLEGALTCGQAEQAISRQLDGASSRGERSQLRAHLRECEACRALARRHRAQRSAFRAALGAVPLPSSLVSLFGGGAGVGAAVATKAAAVVVAAGVAGGIGWDVQHRLTTAKPQSGPVQAAVPRRARTSAAVRPAVEAAALPRARGRVRPRGVPVRRAALPAHAGATVETVPPRAPATPAPQAAPAAAAPGRAQAHGRARPEPRSRLRSHPRPRHVPPAKPAKSHGRPVRTAPAQTTTTDTTPASTTPTPTPDGTSAGNGKPGAQSGRPERGRPH